MKHTAAARVAQLLAAFPRRYLLKGSRINRGTALSLSMAPRLHVINYRCDRSRIILHRRRLRYSGPGMTMEILKLKQLRNKTVVLGIQALSGGVGLNLGPHSLGSCLPLA